MSRCGLYVFHGGCDHCGIEWHSRNVAGLAALHHQKYGHACWYEVGYCYNEDPEIIQNAGGGKQESDGGSESHS